MRRTMGMAGLALAGTLTLAGCGGGSSGNGTALGTGGGGAQLSGACKNVQQTISNIPGKLQKAASSNQPAQNVQNAVDTIVSNLKSESANTSSEFKSAVTDYIDKLQQVVKTASNGNNPDLSQLKTTQIDNICRNAGS